MKKTLAILAIVVVALVAMMSSVNAATVNVQPTNVQKISKGETVTVTVNTVPAQGFQFSMKYDASSFEYVPNAEAGEFVNSNDEPNTLLVLKNAAPAKTNSITFIFKALKDLELITDNAKETENYPFTVTDLQVSRADGEEVTSAEGNLVITATTEGTTTGGTTTPTTPSEPHEGETTESSVESGKTVTSKDVKVGTDGKAITKLPQTGTPVYIEVGVAIVLIGTSLIARKIRK